jgi:hypothetical protein
MRGEVVGRDGHEEPVDVIGVLVDQTGGVGLSLSQLVQLGHGRAARPAT